MYTYTLTIPFNTSRSSPYEKRVKLSAGILSLIQITFPPGCLNLAHVVVLYQAHQIEPWNRYSSFHSDDYNFIVTCNHKIIEPDTEITLRGWNLDTANDHSIDFACQVVQPPVASVEDSLLAIKKALVG